MASNDFYQAKCLLGSIRAFPQHRDIARWRQQLAQLSEEAVKEGAVEVSKTTADEDRRSVIAIDLEWLRQFPKHPDAPAVRQAVTLYRLWFPQLFPQQELSHV